MADINLTHADLNAVLIGGTVNEEVLQQIIDVSRVPLEFTDRLSTSSSGNKRFDWLMDRLAAVDLANAAVDGQDVTGNDALQGQRVGNEMQIFTKQVRISLLGEAADSIGNIGRMARQVNRRGQELMRDMEGIFIGNQGAVVDDGDAVAGLTASLEAWLDGNIIVPAETGATSFVATAARQDLTAGDIAGGGWENNTAGLVPAWVYTTATPVAMTQASIDAVMQALFENTGSRSNRIGMSAPVLHSKISAFYFTSTARVATLAAETDQKGPATAMQAVNAILTDYGIVDLVPNALQTFSATSTESVPDSYTFFILDFNTLEMANMTGFRVDTLAKNGLGDNRLLSKTSGFKPLSTEAQGFVQGIDAAVAMTA